MAKWLNCFGLVLLGLFAPAGVAFALDFPAPEGFVNDFANILSPETKQGLERQLTQLEKDSSIEITVVTIKSLEGENLEDYTSRLFEKWGIGKKDKDNGVLFLIASDDRLMRIEPGYGLEPLLTDAGAGRLLDAYVKPAFQEGNYDQGVSEGVAAIIKIVHGEAVDWGKGKTTEPESGNGVWLLFATGAIFLSYLASFLARSKRWWPGGVLGAALGLVLGAYLVASLVAKILAVVSLGLAGLLFDYVLSKNYKERRKGGLPTTWWGSGGGFFSGGSGGGFGGFGGGFGGGGSGGGGASRGW